MVDWVDWTALGIALTAAGGVLRALVVQKTRAETQETIMTRTAVVDAPVLAQFRELFDRITALEKNLAETRIELKQALIAIDEMKKIEEFLEAKVHEREKAILGLRKELAAAQLRIKHLEEVCKRAGINGEEFV
jgi:uncharacterized coiled-coil DUF342 family protein